MGQVVSELDLALRPAPVKVAEETTLHNQTRLTWLFVLLMLSGQQLN